ncbi:MAG: flagellar motor protein PomA, partial [Anaerohalosphaeraceae bacterium]
MDIGTILGLVVGLGLIAYSIMLGCSLMVFYDLPSVLIVIGGMLCSVIIHFSLPQFLGIFSVI